MTASPEDLVRRLLNADPNVEKSPFTLLYETAYAFEAMAAENKRLREELAQERERCALIAERHVPSSPSAAGEASMRRNGQDIAHSIRRAALSSPAPEGTDGGDEFVP